MSYIVAPRTKIFFCELSSRKDNLSNLESRINNFWNESPMKKFIAQSQSESFEFGDACCPYHHSITIVITYEIVGE